MEIVIDRPKGTRRTFRSANGPVEVTYPLDYGEARGIVNPQDMEEADVFVGTDPAGRCGRFMKGKTLSGSWEPDEFKWFVDCSPGEFEALVAFWNDQFPDLARDFVDLNDRYGVEVDMLRNMIPSHIRCGELDGFYDHLFDLLGDDADIDFDYYIDDWWYDDDYDDEDDDDEDDDDEDWDDDDE